MADFLLFEVEEGGEGDILSILDDHWNILYRPKLRHIKHKNKKVIDALKLTGQDVQTTVDAPSKKNNPLLFDSLSAAGPKNWFSSFQKQEPTIISKEAVSDIESASEPVPDLVVAVNEISVIPVNELAVPISATLDALASVKNEKSWGASFWKGNKDKVEDNHPDVELANLYPDNQTVKYEPMKRTGFAMKFGERI